MKKIFIFLMLLLFTIRAFGQEIPSTEFSKEYYLEKSKKQKTTGWVMLAGGAVVTVVGIIGFSSTDWDESSSDAYAFMTVGGPLICLGSIPFFISSGSNAKKAATLSFSNQPNLMPQQGLLVQNLQPSLSLKIDF
jgi:Na+-transporting methylmalonyl-CoA/oxaloacetate decarboxylase gamma subunit